MTQSMPYALRAPIGRDGKVGLIVLKADESIEQDLRMIFPAMDYAIYVSRIHSDAEVSTDSLMRMKARIADAVRLLPSSGPYDAIGFACTSAAATLGSDVIRAEIESAIDCAHVCDPLQSLLEACQHLGVKTLGIVSPYIESVSERLRVALAEQGIKTNAFTSFNEKTEANVARIDEASISDAVRHVGNHPDVDVVFISCTNLRTLGIVESLEREINKPVFSSNQVLFWNLSRKLPTPISNARLGALFGD